MRKNTSIIIVHWNTPKRLRKLLSLLENKPGFQIIVVDNASSERLDWIKNKFPSTHLIQNKFNRGYAFACNQGTIKAVGLLTRQLVPRSFSEVGSFNEDGEWLLFLNPDVEITPKQITDLINHAEKNNLDACSVKTNDSYQKPLPSLLSLLIEFTPINRLVRFLSPSWRIGMTGGGKKTLFGGCLLIKNGVLKLLGGWDERFFLWFEDSDLTQRLIKNNFKTGWLKIPIKHQGGESFKNLGDQIKKDIFFTSLAVYVKKHFSYCEQTLVSLLLKKYTTRKVLPKINPGVSITVPNLKYNLLKSFFTINKDFLGNVDELIIVTSSLNSQNIWEWRSKYPAVRFIPLDKNKGFASTVNIGFRVSVGKWVGTINDDVFMSDNWIESTISCFKNNIGSVNPVIVKTNGDVESAGIKIEPKGKAIPLSLEYNRDKKLHADYKIVDATNAAAVIYSKEALNKVGLFDETFGSYLEDIDLSLRLKKAGYKNIVSLKSKITHLGQATSKDLGGKKQYLDFKNWLLVILKNWSLKDLLLNLPGILIERLRNISGIIKFLFKANSD